VISAGRILKALAIGLMLAVPAYVVSKVNLFGLESASDRLADQVYQRITAADYGKARQGQNAVRVIYLDETSIEALKGYGWTRFPPTYEQQWTMLEDLLYAGGAPPSAMFVDFVYMGQGGAADGFDTFLAGVAGATHAEVWSDKPACVSDPLSKIACIIGAGGVPIIFAKPSPADLDLFTDVQQALDKVSVLAPALVGEEAYPLITDYGFYRAKAVRLGVHQVDISPAMAMYAAYCLRRADGCGVNDFQALKARAAAALNGHSAPRAPNLAEVFDAPLDVVWGSRPDPDYLALTKAVSGRPANCRSAASGWRARVFEQMAILRGPGSGAQQECPYTLSLGYDRLVGGQGLETRDVANLLAGRMVMVGGHFHASSDWIESPVHGQVPGVQYHAMALDNLIEDGVDYRRNANAMLDSDLLKGFLVFALAVCGVLGVMVRNSLLDEAVAEGVEPRLRAVVYAPLYTALFATSLGVVVLATWLGVAYAHRSPINWIGLSGVVLAFLFYATRQTLPADLSGSFEKSRLVRRFIAWRRLYAQALRFEEDRLLRPKPPPAPKGPAAPPAETEPAAAPAAIADTAEETPAHVQA
jgi:hypothetical protein